MAATSNIFHVLNCSSRVGGHGHDITEEYVCPAQAAAFPPPQTAHAIHGNSYTRSTDVVSTNTMAPCVPGGEQGTNALQLIKHLPG